MEPLVNNIQPNLVTKNKSRDNSNELTVRSKTSALSSNNSNTVVYSPFPIAEKNGRGRNRSMSRGRQKRKASGSETKEPTLKKMWEKMN